MPRFYGFDGSTGMDLRPVGQLERRMPRVARGNAAVIPCP